MQDEFINITSEHVKEEQLSCIIRTKKPHAGIEKKRAWLAKRLKEGHVFRKLNVKGTAFIEYAPLEAAWVPIAGEKYHYIYCLWVTGPYKGKGYGAALMEYCIKDSIEKGKSGICMLGSIKQKAWLSDQSFAKKYGFEVVDRTEDGYELLALSFDGSLPKFFEYAKRQRIDSQELTIYYHHQCPYIYERIEKIKENCELHRIPLSLHHVQTLEQAKALPCVFQNFALFYKGKFVTVNILDVASIEKLVRE